MRSMQAFWMGGAGAAPPSIPSGRRSMLAFWMGGASGSVAQGAGGIGSSGGMTGWDGKIHPFDELKKPLGHERIYFNDAQARPIQQAQEVIERVKEARPEQAQQLYSDAENVVWQLRIEIERLELMAIDLQALGRRAEIIRVEMAIEQMKAQIEEIDMVFVIFAISSQLH